MNSTIVKVNRKVKNAQECEWNGIKFKSKFEMECAKILTKEDIKYDYESRTFVLFHGFKGYENGKKKTYKDITYTPDFMLHDYKIFLEIKGFPNDVYPYKKKMFIGKYMANPAESWSDWQFYEVHSIRELKELIKELHETIQL